jgi:hypothetical protein
MERPPHGHEGGVRPGLRVLRHKMRRRRKFTALRGLKSAAPNSARRQAPAVRGFFMVTGARIPAERILAEALRVA